MDVVVCHINADFDCLGALVGAARLYPGAAMVLPGGEAPGVRAFLSLHREVFAPRVPAEVDRETITRVIVVDTASRNRLGPAADWLDLPDVEVHLYDHHPDDGDVEASFRRVAPVGAVSSLIAACLRERGEVPNPVEATALLLGIYEDTGSLAHAGTTPEDLEAAAWLLRAGGDLDVVAEFTRRSLTPEQRRLLADLRETAELRDVRGVRVVIAAAPSGPYVEDAAVLAHPLLEVEEAGAAFILARMDGALYVIGRSATDAVNVGEALRALGGGGHARAASATIKDSGDLPPADEGREAPQGDLLAAVKARLLPALERNVAPERTARELMSYPVRTVSPEATIAETWRRMVRYGHSGMVVMDHGRLAGVITRRDVDKARHHHLDHAPVRGFMTTDVTTVSPGTPLSELERTLIGHDIGRLPVVEDGAVLGIVTRTDVLRALHGARYLEGTPPVAPEPVLQLLRERLPAPVQRLLEDVGRVAEGTGSHAYVVGGFVRDVLLDRRSLEDLDVLAEPDGAALARAVAAECGGEVKATERFGTATLTLPDGLKLDFATARTESYAHPGALPDVEPSSVVDDLRRRDFRFNAMAIALRPERFGALLDPFGGRADLERGRVRVLHNLSFIEDPTRIFRAVRFEERFHFRMDAHTERLARHSIETDALARISPERLRAVLYRTFREAKALGPLLRLQDLGVLSWMHPELALDPPLLQGLPGALQWWEEQGGPEAADACLVYLSALLAPLGAEGAARTAEERLHVPPPQLRKVEAALRAVERAVELLPPDAEPAVLTRALQGLDPEALVLLRARAGATAGAGQKSRAPLDRFVREWRHTKLEITGEDLKALGTPPGPALGEALRATLDAKLNGKVRGRAAELAFARAFLDRREPPHRGATRH